MNHPIPEFVINFEDKKYFVIFGIDVIQTNPGRDSMRTVITCYIIKYEPGPFAFYAGTSVKSPKDSIAESLFPYAKKAMKRAVDAMVRKETTGWPEKVEARFHEVYSEFRFGLLHYSELGLTEVQKINPAEKAPDPAPEPPPPPPPGLYRKYRISKADGTPVDPNAEYFVLRLDKDVAARAAALTYAKEIRNQKPKLAADIDRLINKLETPPASDPAPSPPQTAIFNSITFMSREEFEKAIALNIHTKAAIQQLKDLGVNPPTGLVEQLQKGNPIIVINENVDLVELRKMVDEEIKRRGFPTQ